MRNLRKTFKEYEKISNKIFHKFAFAYSKPRETILEIRGQFASCRMIFSMAMNIVNEGHNQDQARRLKEQAKLLKEIDKKAIEARKESKRRQKAEDESNKKSSELLNKIYDELRKGNNTTAETQSKVLEGWLVKEKGVGIEDAKSCASTALKEGKMPNVKKVDDSKPKLKPKPKGENTDKQTIGGDVKLEAKVSKIKKDELKSGTLKHPVVKEGNEAKTVKPKPEVKKSTPKEDNSTSKSTLNEKKPEPPAKKVETTAPKKDQKEKGKGVEAPVKKVQAEPPNVEKKATQSTPKADPKSVPNKPVKNQKVPVIVVQDSRNKNNKDKTKPRSPSPAPSTSAKSSSPTITIVGRSKPRASSISGEKSAKEQRDMIEKSVRYVKGARVRARSQDPPQNLSVVNFG